VLLLHARLPLQVFLIFGRSGWIGGLVGEYLKEKGAKFEYATARLEDRSSILADIERVQQQQHDVIHVCGAAEAHELYHSRFCLLTWLHCS
jgi:hypothetical protein